MMHGGDGERKLAVLTFGKQLSLFDYKCNRIRIFTFFFYFFTVQSIAISNRCVVNRARRSAVTVRSMIEFTGKRSENNR